MDVKTITRIIDELGEEGRAVVQMDRNEVFELVEILYREGHAVYPDRLEPGRYRLVPRRERAVR